MNITLVQGLLIASATGFLAISTSFEFMMWQRPLFSAFITGLILGNPKLGCQVGALAELAFAGLMPVGGASVPHGTLEGVMASVLAITKGLNQTEAFTLALPFAYFMQYLSLIKTTAMSFINPNCDKVAATGDAKAVVRLHWMIVGLDCLFFAVVAFLCVYAAQNAISAIVDAFPETLLHGLKIAGGIMPAVGFSMMLSVILKVELSPFLILGFVMACIIEMTNALPVALVGLSIALFYYFFIAKDEDIDGGIDDGI